jgi:phosphohistidine phosphatase
MRRLLMLRHAKAVQESGDGDFSRVLTERGRADAMQMGHTLDTASYLPELVICSSARRTVETFETLLPELAKPPRVAFLKSLYLASPKIILDELRKASDDARTVMMVGHNPGIEDLAAALARQPQSQDEVTRLESLREKYPTCALVVLDFEVKFWKEIAQGRGALTNFIRPRDVRD